MLSRYSFKKTQSLVATMILITTILGGCTKNKSDKDLMVYRGTHPDDVKSLDPAVAYDTISWDIVPSIYDTLYQYEYLADPYKIVPLLAADMPEISKDRLTITIPIRKDVRYHDNPCFKDTNGKGRTIKAQDFIFAWKRLAIPSVKSQGLWIFEGKVKGLSEFKAKMRKAEKSEIMNVMKDDIEGLKAIDDHTLQIKLIRPYPQLKYILAMAFTSPLAPEAVIAYQDEDYTIHDKPVGTGPFLLKEWKRGHRIILEKNPNYYSDFFPKESHERYREKGMLADAGKPLPFLDRVEIDVIKEDQPAWLKFMKGELDRMRIPKDNFAQAITDRVHISPEFKEKGIEVSIEPATVFFYVSFNMKDPVIGKSKYLRQAFSSAIDREKFIELFRNNRDQKATTALPAGIADRPENTVVKYDFNIEKAKALLKKAGYPGGKGLPEIKFDMRGASSLNRQMGDYFSQQFAKIGIKLKVVLNTFPAYLEKMKDGHLQVSMGGWGLDYPDAENVYQLLYGPNKAPGPNESNFDHPEMNKLYNQMAILESGARRSAIVKRMDEILQEECPWALLYYRNTYQVSYKRLKNYRQSEIIQNRYKYYRIERP